MNEIASPTPAVSPWRRFAVISCIVLSFVGLSVRAFYLQVLAGDFYQEKGKRQQVREVKIPAHRGMLLDRNGTPLAISAPVHAVCVNPREFQASPGQIRQLAKYLGQSSKKLEKNIQRHRNRGFLYLKRQLAPSIAEKIDALDIKGVFLQSEFRRYYPAGEVTAHLLGFTDIDQRGQEGLEKWFDPQLQGIPGLKRVLRDRRARIIEDIDLIRPPRPGKDIRLSLDARLQYWAYRVLKQTVKFHHAKGGSVVMLDARTGEVLALANQPEFNPNVRGSLRPARFRNRAIVDVFEPGSTMKPVAIACALKARVVRPGFRVDTSPGHIRVGRHWVRDHKNEGPLDLAGILHKSSNVGITKVTLRLTPKDFSSCLQGFGFGRMANVDFPGEAKGVLTDYRGWGQFEQATLAFGYGLSVSALQLARAYTVFADRGRLHSVSLTPRVVDDKVSAVMPATIANLVRTMLEGVVSEAGTARRAQIPGYRVAGKTGTVRKAIPGGYAKDRYLSLFVGMAPASAPRLVLAVIIDEPQGKRYYGGEVAAPAFARIMGAALRLMGIAPDRPAAEDTILVRRGDGEMG